MTDSEFMLALLFTKPRTTMEIVAASIAERGCGLTPHSRAADLRRQGHRIECKALGRQAGRTVYEYRLASSVEPPLSNVLGDDDPIAHRDVGRGGSAGDGQLALALPGSAYRKDVAA